MSLLIWMSLLCYMIRKINCKILNNYLYRAFGIEMDEFETDLIEIRKEIYEIPMNN